MSQTGNPNTDKPVDYDLPDFTEWDDTRLWVWYVAVRSERERRQAAADARYDPNRPPGAPDWPQAD